MVRAGSSVGGIGILPDYDRMINTPMTAAPAAAGVRR
jgi:hypothetical protein